MLDCKFKYAVVTKLVNFLTRLIKLEWSVLTKYVCFESSFEGLFWAFKFYNIFKQLAWD